ncbi:MAG: hypothetical protein ACK2UO_04890, partial [Caldilineaceae bacterium]
PLAAGVCVGVRVGVRVGVTVGSSTTFAVGSAAAVSEYATVGVLVLVGVASKALEGVSVGVGVGSVTPGSTLPDVCFSDAAFVSVELGLATSESRSHADKGAKAVVVGANTSAG